MRPCGTLLDMNEQSRKLAGEIARAALDRSGQNVRQAATRLNMSPSTLYKIFNGDPKVTRSKLRAFEGGVNLPTDTLTLVIQENRGAVEELEFTDMGLRRLVLAGLDDLSAARVQKPGKARRGA